MGSRRAKAKRGFGEVDALPSGRFRARYTGPDGARHSASITFMARIDAEGWLVAQERMISRGEREPPRRQTREAQLLLLGEYAAAVVGRRRIRPGTAALYAKLLRLTILPAFAGRPLAEITAAEISTWYAGMRTTPTQQANAYGLLKSIFKEAVEEGLVTVNPYRQPVQPGRSDERCKWSLLSSGSRCDPRIVTAAARPCRPNSVGGLRCASLSRHTTRTFRRWAGEQRGPRVHLHSPTHSPRQGDDMTIKRHRALSEGYCRRRAERFNSPLAHQRRHWSSWWERRAGLGMRTMW